MAPLWISGRGFLLPIAHTRLNSCVRRLTLAYRRLSGYGGHMGQTYFRVQSADRDAADLLDPGYQFSHAYSGQPHLTRVGVSACESLEELAEYLVCGQAGALESGVRSGHWVLVKMEADGTLPGAVDDYEVLVRPTVIVSVAPVDDDFLAMMDAANDFLAGFADPNRD